MVRRNPKKKNDFVRRVRGCGSGGRPLYLGCGVSARLGRLSGAYLAFWGAFRPGGALFGVLARAGNAAPHKKALVFFINAGKFLADGGRLALFGGHITHNARAGVCFAALRE